MTRVVHCNKETYDVYIGRPSKWGNPFKVGVDGTKDEVISMYEEYVRNTPSLMADLHELEGKTLACWCKPTKCHGDALVNLLLERKLFDF